MPSQLEIENASKVLAMLEQIDGITYDTIREDIFSVTETESGDMLQLTVDVEESTVCLIMDVGDVSQFTPKRAYAEDMEELYHQLLLVNDQTVHGKFGITKEGKILLRDTLEIQNLDTNELEASMGHMFLTAAQHVPNLIATSFEA